MNVTTAKKTCSICSKRPVPSTAIREAEGMSLGMDYCVPCFTEANWENSHSDHNHTDYATLTVRGTSFKNKADLDAYKAEMAAESAECWVCRPELNEAARDYAPRQGTSRAGMIINVPIREAGQVKAKVVQDRLSADVQNNRFTIKVSTARKSGIVTLTASSAQESFSLTWDDRGRFTGGTVTENGKVRKVRNVAEVLRLAL